MEENEIRIFAYHVADTYGRKKNATPSETILAFHLLSAQLRNAVEAGIKFPS